MPSAGAQEKPAFSMREREALFSGQTSAQGTTPSSSCWATFAASSAWPHPRLRLPSKTSRSPMDP